MRRIDAIGICLGVFVAAGLVYAGLQVFGVDGIDQMIRRLQANNHGLQSHEQALLADLVEHARRKDLLGSERASTGGDRDPGGIFGWECHVLAGALRAEVR